MTEARITRAAHGRVVTDVDPCGNVFVATPAVARPVAGARVGPPQDSSVVRDLIYQCPQSAIPDAVWDLLAIWWQSRQLKLPVVEGGYVDQPVIVRRAWPIFEHEMVKAERLMTDRASEHAMAAAVAALMQGRV